MKRKIRFIEIKTKSSKINLKEYNIDCVLQVECVNDLWSFYTRHEYNIKTSILNILDIHQYYDSIRIYYYSKVLDREEKLKRILG